MFASSVSSSLEDNVAHPGALHLLDQHTALPHHLLAHDGAGLGTAWGAPLACQMLHDAGFRGIDVLDLPNEPINALFVARKDG